MSYATPEQVEVFAATAKRRTFALLTSTWMLGYNNNELEVRSRDPEEVMRMLPSGVICFRFFDRIVADVEVGDEVVQSLVTKNYIKRALLNDGWHRTHIGLTIN